MRVQEMHIALDMALQQINSNRQQSISIDHKDMALNYAVLQFVETRTNPKTNIKQEGTEDTTKRYDDIKDLKRVSINKAYINGNKAISYLPVDYYKYLEFGTNLKYTKFNNYNTESIDFHYYVLPFPDSKEDRINYTKFTIKGDRDPIFTTSDYTGLPNLYNKDAKFMIINLVLEELNKIEGIDVYWEYFGNVYKKQSFIIVNIGESVIHQSYTISYDRESFTSKHINDKYNTYESIKDVIEKPVEINSSEFTINGNNNSYHNKNRHLKPKGDILNNKLEIEIPNNTYITTVKCIYLKKPRLISYRHNQMCEIQVNREIIDLAVTKLQAYMKDNGYQFNKAEQQIIE